MKTKLNEKTENAIIIQGVVLTDKAVTMLKSLQDDDNYMINESKIVICNAICNMLQLLDASEQDSFRDKINSSVVSLTYVREYLEDLQKP